jgi:imidazolonepropionase-like amidohydrolase
MMTFTLLLAAALAADTTRYVVWNHGREAGDMTVVRSADTVVVRYQHTDRNRGVASARSYRIDKTGRVLYGESLTWPFGGEIGAPSDRFEVVRDSLLFGVAPGQTGRIVLEADMYPRLRPNITAFDQALVAKWLLSRPNRTGRAMPAGATMRADVLTEATVSTKAGRKRVKLVALYTNTMVTPATLWLDERNELFAGGVEWFIPVVTGGEAALPTLRAAEIKWRNAQGLAAAKSLDRPAGTTIIRNADVFDSERGVIVPGQTIVVTNDRIVSVGAAPATVPAGAREIDASGKTVIPGMWDMHGHLQATSQTTGAILQLATGLTTVRDLASDIDVATWYRDGVNRGDLLGARAVLAGFIEGPGKWAGPGDVLVRTEQEARDWVARFDSLGYKQIKLYNIVHPDLLPTISAEAKKRGMRLSGHVPRGLSVPAAIRLGFDEINHAAFLFSTFYQDSLYLPTMRAYSAVASAVAPNVDVNGAPFTSLIEIMRTHNTVLDGTFNIWTSTASAGVGAPPVNQKGVDNYLRMIARLDSAGVVLVPGTDNSSGASYVTELETYVRAGLSPVKVMQMATITSARVMKDDRDYGSIAPGKIADIVIINGKPHERISDLRNVEYVMRAGRTYTPSELRGVLGMRMAQRATRR